MSPIVDRTEVQGWASCMDSLCEGYKQTPTPIIVETVSWTFGEKTGWTGDPYSAALTNVVENQTESPSVFVREADAVCPVCGGPRIASADKRPVYEQISGQDPLELAIRQRAGLAAQVKVASAADRQADALEEANRLKARELDLKEREMLALGSGNGHQDPEDGESDPRPAPARRTRQKGRE